MNTTTQVTTEQSNSLIHTIDINDSTANINIKIRLNDECKNGHQDFAITATIWEIGKVRNDRTMISGGCCHEKILAIRPDLQVFVTLHLCDFSGCPMYAVENGFYHLTNGFNNTKPNEANFKAKFCSYYRITAEQFDILAQSENKLRYAINLQKLGILLQWMDEARQAILLLEQWTGKKFLIDSVKTQYTAPTAEQIADEQAKENAGYYLPSKIQECKDKAIQYAKDKEYYNLLTELGKARKKAQREYDVKKAVLDGGLSLDNFIYYTHTNEGCFNWKNYGEIVTEQQFDDFVRNSTLSDITWKNKG
jgi:hypothetical protein